MCTIVVIVQTMNSFSWLIMTEYCHPRTLWSTCNEIITSNAEFHEVMCQRINNKLLWCWFARYDLVPLLQPWERVELLLYDILVLLLDSLCSIFIELCIINVLYCCYLLPRCYCIHTNWIVAYITCFAKFCIILFIFLTFRAPY